MTHRDEDADNGATTHHITTTTSLSLSRHEAPTTSRLPPSPFQDTKRETETTPHRWDGQRRSEWYDVSHAMPPRSTATTTISNTTTMASMATTTTTTNSMHSPHRPHHRVKTPPPRWYPMTRYGLETHDEGPKRRKVLVPFFPYIPKFCLLKNFY
jgi:hypothetical protein